MLRILAYNHYNAFSSDNLTLLADLFYGRLNFHISNLHCVIVYCVDRETQSLRVILPFVGSYTDTSTSTLSPGTILI